MADFEQAQQMIPLITSEISFGWNICGLVLGINVLDLDFWVQVNSIEQPLERNFVGPGNMSHCWTSAFHNHLDHSLIVFKHKQQSFLTRVLTASGTE